MKRFHALGLVMCFMIIALLPGFSFSEEAKNTATYIIHPTDVLEVSVYGEEDLIRKLVVRPDGNISFPLIGDIHVAGLTTQQVKEIIDKKINTFIPEATSTVIVDELGSLKFYVLGKVAKPGVFNVSSEITVLQALALAGGLSTFADEDGIIIVRGHGADTKKIPFDYSDVKKGNKLEQNILLEREDVVVVP